MDTLAELIDLYLLRCEVEGKSPNTVRAYRWTLERFLITLCEQGAPERADAIERDFSLSPWRVRRMLECHATPGDLVEVVSDDRAEAGASNITRLFDR